jgi:ammonium transporter, Amt family
MDNIVTQLLQAAPQIVAAAYQESSTAVAETVDTAALSLFTVNNVWMMLATGLVFIMHLGFATLESGLTRSKNTVNVLFKNTITPAIGLLTYALVGFSLMYPGFENGVSMDFFGFSGFGLNLPENGTTSAYNPGYTFWTDFLFQGMFAATCATIVSGAVAERIKLEAYVVFTLVYVSLVYPIIGSWKWGYGWLNTLGFYDFAGSTLVHSVGGWGALAGILLLGPRVGKYVDGKINPIPGHSMPLAVIGVFMLWLGWFGFNGGSVLSADPGLTSLVLVTTSLAAAAGAIGAMFTSFFIFKKHDLSMVLNGVLGGLVGITAGADQMGVVDSVLIGLISGGLVVVAVLLFDKAKLDDPVGALSVHLVCGVFGTLAVGIFGAKAGISQFITQLIGVGAAGAASFVAAFAIFFIIKKTMGVRVSKQEEVEGLDVFEHGMSAYAPNVNNEVVAING